MTLAIAPATANAGVRQIEKLANPAGAESDEFGCALALLGDRLFIGARFDDTFADDAGAVYVFDRIGESWTMTDVLSPDIVRAGQAFGWSLAVDPAQPDLLIVGSPWEDGVLAREGAVYVFVDEGANGYVQEARLDGGGSPDNAQFGSALAFDGTTLIVGVPFESNFIGAVVGDAYFFERDPLGFWYPPQKVFPSVAPSGAIFGASVAIEGDLAIIGAPYLAASFTPGAAYVFSRMPTGWEEEQRLFNPTSSGRTRFGASSAISDGIPVVGSPRDTPPPIGVVVSFGQDELGDWTPIEAVNATDYLPFDRFGGRLIVDGTRMIAAAPTYGDTGAVYLHEFDSGVSQFVRKIRPADLGSLDLFGSALAISGDILAVGAPDQDESVADAGVVYLFELTDDPLGDLNCDGLVDFDDVSHFVQALLDPEGYEADHDGDPYANCDRFLADMSRSATVDGLDVEAFALTLVSP